MSEIALSFDFIEKYVRFTKPEYIQIYLYLKYSCEKNGSFPGLDELLSAIDLPKSKIEHALSFWVSRGELWNSGDEYGFNIADKAEAIVPEKPKAHTSNSKTTRPSYSQSEIDSYKSKHRDVAELFNQAENILNKTLTVTDSEMLFSFVDWLGLPVEVIIMLLSYAANRGKTSKRYLETVAIDWAEKGIDTFEAAENYVSYLESIDSAERQIRSILGIYDRALTQTEKKYIKLWAENSNISNEFITYAYDKTVEYTGKLSCSYMDKMLSSWVENGFKTIDDVKAANEEFYKNGGKKPEKAAKPTKFNNYDDGNKNDYAELDEHILDLMLENDIN